MAFATELKRIIKLAVSACVFVGDKVSEGAQKMVGKAPRPKAVVLYYHGVSDAERPGFARQMEMLKRKVDVIDCVPRDLRPGAHYAAVTFDDGFVSVVENALPTLRQHGIPTTIFVPSGYLGTKPGWVKNAALLERQEIIVSAPALKSLSEDALVCIGSHTVTHPRLASVEKAKAESELQDSKKSLEQIIGRPVDLFSFPHGSFNSDVLQLARNAGYKRVFGVKPAMAFEEPGEFLTGRVAVDPMDWTIEFILKVNGAYRWMA